MRFALRKQDKIKEVLGNEYLENNILQSLNKYFENSDNDQVLLIATLLLGIWQIKNPKLKTADDLSDDLCLYCPLDDDEKGTHGVPNGYISCEGRCCQEAYEMYIE